MSIIYNAICINTEILIKYTYFDIDPPLIMAQCRRESTLWKIHIYQFPTNIIKARRTDPEENMY